MNKQIKHLAVQALVHANTTWDPQSDPNEFVAIAMEKHAELIIRECAFVCRSQDNKYALEFDRENCAVAIEQHFGIK